MSSEVRQGDCLEVVRDLPAESVDLVYVDPPFFTQKSIRSSREIDGRRFSSVTNGVRGPNICNF